MTRKQMERADRRHRRVHRARRLPARCRCAPTPPGMRIRLALGVVTSIDPEILLLDEGIGAVDAAFLEKSQEAAGASWSTAPACWSSPPTPTSSCASCATPPSGWSTAGSSSRARSRRSCGLQGPTGVTGDRADRGRPASASSPSSSPGDRAELLRREPGRRRRRRAGRLDHVVVVDNGPDDAVAGRRSRTADCRPPTCPAQRNLGGAGGFALGMLHALALGADWVWCADDDGRPADDDGAGHPAGRGASATAWPRSRRWSPTWPTPSGWPSRCAAGCAGAGGAATSPGSTSCRGYASLFNGALFRADALDVVGVPDYRLFFRGDETEIHRRLRRARGCRSAPAVAGRLPAPRGDDGVPADPRRAAVGAVPRRRGQALLHLPQPRLPDGAAGHALAAPLEWIRFGYFFLVHRRDRAGLARVAAADHRRPARALHPPLTAAGSGQSSRRRRATRPGRRTAGCGCRTWSAPIRSPCACPGTCRCPAGRRRAPASPRPPALASSR